MSSLSYDCLAFLRIDDEEKLLCTNNAIFLFMDLNKLQTLNFKSHTRNLKIRKFGFQECKENRCAMLFNKNFVIVSVIISTVLLIPSEGIFADERNS